MAGLALCGFETGSTLEVASPSGLTIDSTIKRSGNYSGKMAVAGSCRVYTAPAPITTSYTRVCVYVTALPSANSVIAQWLDVGAVLVCNLTLLPAGTLRVGAVLNGTTVLTVNTWHVIELFVDTVADQIEIRLNGRREVAGAVVMANPMNGLNLLWTGGAVGSFCYFDDVAVNSTTWPGPGHVIARQGILGTPTYDMWSKTGGTIDVVWSDFPFNAATNAQTTAASQKQTMVVASPADLRIGLGLSQTYGQEFISALDTIHGCKSVMIGKRASGAANINLLRIVGGVETATAINPTTVDAYFDDGVWTTTYANLLAVEVGVERGATGIGNMIVEDMWLMIDYTPAVKGYVGFTGFEIGSFGEVQAITNTVAIETTTIRTGGYSAKITHHASESTIDVLPPGRPMEQYGELYLRFYFRVSALPGSLTTVARFKPPVGLGVELKLRTTGILEAFGNGVSIGVGVATALSINTWYRVELRGAVSPTGSTSPTGIVQLRVNGVDFASTGVIDVGGMFEKVHLMYHGTATNFCFVDDVAISDVGFVGTGQVISRSPVAGTPTNDGWVKTGGATIDLVWADTPTNAATYANASGANGQQTAIIGPFTSTQAGKGTDVLPADAGILAVREVVYGRVAPAPSGMNTHQLQRRVGGAVKRTNIIMPLTSGPIVEAVPWTTTVALMDSLEAGGRQLDGITYLMRIEDVWMTALFNTPIAQLIDELTATLSDTIVLLVEKIENNDASVSDTITLVLSLVALTDTIFLGDVVTLLASLLVSDDATIVDTAALLLILGAVADETLAIEDVVAFLLEIVQDGGTITVSDVVATFQLGVTTRQAVYAPRWLIEIEDA